MRISVTHPTGGADVVRAAIARGHSVVNNPRLTCDAAAEAADVGYVRTCTYAPWRSRGLEMLSAFQRAGVPSVPSFADSLLYDDKRTQARVLAKWMPRTHVVTDEAFLPEMQFPFISKSSRGASSKNVRLVRTPADADAERAAVFGADGLKVHGETQQGYLIWQELVEGNDHDIRVVVNGDRLYGLWRFNREHVPFASGSGKRNIIPSLDDPQVRAAFALGSEIATALETRWACFDFVFRDGRPLVLEISFSWTENAYLGCQLFDRATLEPTGETAALWPELLVAELERLVDARKAAA